MKVQILIGMRRLPVYSGTKGPILISDCICVQKREFAFLLFLICEFDIRLDTVNVIHELL